jgi:hypothetical protein
MKEPQKIIILKLLSDKGWHCTSEMSALYMVDYRRRLVDLKKDGYKFENRRCTQHHHPMKEWRLVQQIIQNPEIQSFISPRAAEFLLKYPSQPIKQPNTLF